MEIIVDDKQDKDKIIITKMSGNYLEGLKDFYLKDTGIPTGSFGELDESLIKDKAVYVLCPHGDIPDIAVPGISYEEYYGGRLRVNLRSSLSKD